MLLKRISWVTVAIGAGCLLAGCATGMKGSARRQCYDSGLQPGSQAFENCWQGIAARDNAQVLSTLGEVAVGYAIINSAPAPSGYSTVSASQLKREWFAQSGDKMCLYENGTVLNVRRGRCFAAIK